MLYNANSVRDNIRNRDGKRVFYLGKGDQLTSDAREYLLQQRIEILPAEAAKPERYRLLSGGYMEEKPEHMTHLFGDVLVEKTHPRIAFRGEMDALEAEILLCQLRLPHLKEPLGELLTLSRRLLSAEVMGEIVPETPLGGLDPAQLRAHSHRPQEFYGKPHFMPQAGDGETVLLLNKLRTTLRTAERSAVAAMPDKTDLLQALNRMSSFVYILMIQEKNN